MQELEETVYWLNLLIDSGIVKKAQVSELCDEGGRIDGNFCGFG